MNKEGEVTKANVWITPGEHQNSKITDSILIAVRKSKWLPFMDLGVKIQDVYHPSHSLSIIDATSPVFFCPLCCMWPASSKQHQQLLSSNSSRAAVLCSPHSKLLSSDGSSRTSGITCSHYSALLTSHAVITLSDGSHFITTLMIDLPA